MSCFCMSFLRTEWFEACECVCTSGIFLLLLVTIMTMCLMRFSLCILTISILHKGTHLGDSSIPSTYLADPIYCNYKYECLWLCIYVPPNFSNASVFLHGVRHSGRNLTIWRIYGRTGKIWRLRMLALLHCLVWSALPGFVLVRLWEGDLLSLGTMSDVWGQTIGKMCFLGKEYVSFSYHLCDWITAAVHANFCCFCKIFEAEKSVGNFGSLNNFCIQSDLRLTTTNLAVVLQSSSEVTATATHDWW